MCATILGLHIFIECILTELKFLLYIGTTICSYLACFTRVFPSQWLAFSFFYSLFPLRVDMKHRFPICTFLVAASESQLLPPDSSAFPLSLGCIPS